ncbi:MAG: site-specific DNA-methyltransferase [Sulfurospirillum sp.]|nr:site-specific DNA-methyltransferase [Sulfurospirillum sp.]MBL0702660.1 site-specific DNA-methyltransferase [Sulfurospirillum sp.]
MENQKLIFSDNDLIEKKYRIYNGDCIEVLKKIPKKSVDLIFADPPYNLQLKNELYRPNQTKVDGVNDEWDKFNSNEEYDNFTKEWLSACREIMNNEATIWVIGSYHNIFRVGKIMMDLGFWVLNDVQWYKTNPMPNFRGVRFTNATETLIWAKKSEKQKRYTFNHNVMKQLNGGKQMTSVWNIPLCTGHERIKGADGKKAHSTQKPEELLKRVILSSSKEGDIILDPFSGSGTTCAVAKKLNRCAIGIEKEEKYIKISKKRLASINTSKYTHLQLKEPKKEVLQRVSMDELVKNKYFTMGQTIFTKNKKHIATILDDGTIKNGIGTGSIHKIGAKIKEAQSCNGWMFWCYDDNGETKLIDEKRKEYRVAYAG